jgi:hypothetical protein
MPASSNPLNIVGVMSVRTYLLPYLLTPWSRVLLEKLTGFQLVKKFLAFYGIRRFITAFTSARHLSEQGRKIKLLAQNNKTTAKIYRKLTNVCCDKIISMP